MIKIVENIFYTKIQSHKLLKTLFDVFFSAVSDETTLKLFYRADRTSLPYLWGLPELIFSKNGI